MVNSLRIRIVPYRIIPDKDHYIIEHLSTGEFYEMPHTAVEGLKALAEGNSPDQVELDLTYKYPNEEINMSDFLHQLKDMGFIVDDGDESDWNIANERLATNTLGIGRFLFHKNVIPFYVILICANILFFSIRTDLFPQPKDLFPFDSMMLNIIVSFVVSVVLLAIHECGHVVAARAFGLTSNVRIGHRLFLPVIETQMPTIWRLPRNSRNIPLLAGLFMDHTILFVSLCALLFMPALSMAITGILGLIVFQLIMMSLYQCMFFMKTDLYYLLQNVLGSYNLLENAEGWMKEKLPFIQFKNTNVIYDKELNIVRSYAVVYIIGLLGSIAILVVYIIPQLIYSFSISLERLINPQFNSMKVDAILYLTQFSLYLGLLVFSWGKKYSRSGT